MANTFKDISQFTLKSAATGTEEFQVSATEKVTAQQIANKVQLSQVIMSGFSALNFTGIEKIKDSNSLLGALAILYDLLGKGNIKMVSNGSTEYGFVSMGNVSDTTHGFGWLLSISEKAIYIKNDFTSPNPSTLNNIQWVNAIKTGEKVSLDSGGIQTVTVTNFQTNVWNNDAGTNVFSSVPVGGMVVFKSAADATSGPGEALMGYAIKISSIIASYVGMTTTNGANVTPTLYTHKSSSLYATKWQKLPDADNVVQVTAFTESALLALISNYKTGDLIPFYTGNVTASADNQFPESGVFNGFISIGSNEGDYCQIFAFKTGSPKAYIGACIGSTTQWTTLGGGGGMEKISNWSDSRYVNANEDAGISETVNFPLTRALKSTDIVLVTWRKENASSTNAEIAGHAIFHPGAYSQDVGLEVVEDFQDSTNYYGLFMNQTETEIGSTSLNMYGVSRGPNAYGPHYLITGIYNLSGQ